MSRRSGFAQKSSVQVKSGQGARPRRHAGGAHGYRWGVGLIAALVLGLPACGEGEDDAGQASKGPQGSGSDGNESGDGSGGESTGTGGNGNGNGSGSGGTGLGEPPTSLPGTCAEAAPAYRIETLPVGGGSLTAEAGGGGFFASRMAYLPVAIHEDGRVYVGLNDASGAVIANLDEVVTRVDGARMGGVAATHDGAAALLFDREDELWAAVHRFSEEGEELFATRLYDSPNLEDEGTKGEAGTSRFGYLTETDTLVAYFGHTQMYFHENGDHVRHQGGYLATLDADGDETRLSGWFGSHNLDQRLWIGPSEAALLGLGDAYPIGIFFSPLVSSPQARVVHRVAAAGNGTANAQLGGLLDGGDVWLAPFLTNLSVSPDVDAGEWPDIDETVAAQIREAANNPTDMGLIAIPRTGNLPSADDIPVVWLEPELAEGARLDRLKSARYGDGDLILLLWSEVTGSNRNQMRSFYTMVVDPTGAICQPKTPLSDAYAIAGGDDLVLAPDGSIVWATDASGSVELVRLIPTAE